MEIRRLTIDDYEELTGLWRRAGLHFKQKGRDSKEALRMQMAAKPQFFFGVFENNDLVGAVILSSDIRRGWINRLAVDPRYRRKGIAQALIAESEKVFKKEGLPVISVHVEDWNVASQKLFRKCGYAEHHDVIYFSKRDSDEV
jgi:ribosomal protein S18 acetylase RimI-like enzyme